MPDAHLGNEATVGSVIPTLEAVMPAAGNHRAHIGRDEQAMENSDPAATRAAVEAHMSTANRRLLNKEAAIQHGMTGADGE